MSRSFGQADEVEALSLDNKVGLFAGDAAPWDEVITNAPIGSRYFRTNGDSYKKTGSGDTSGDWELISTSAVSNKYILGW